MCGRFFSMGYDIQSLPYDIQSIRVAGADIGLDTIEQDKAN